MNKIDKSFLITSLIFITFIILVGFALYKDYIINCEVIKNKKYKCENEVIIKMNNKKGIITKYYVDGYYRINYMVRFSNNIGDISEMNFLECELTGE